jgi:5-formyltetrahydrofolate cyclo-ligase
MTSDGRDDRDGHAPPSSADGTSVADRKRSVRRELLAARRSVPADEIAAASTRIVARFRALPELDGARTVLLYAADPDEVDLSALIDLPPTGCEVLLPRAEEHGLVAVRHPPGSELVIGGLGVREPVGPAVDASGIDAVVVPGVAFTHLGARLGRGRGLYDRLLPRLRAVRIGVCLEGLVVDDLPSEAHDVAMDLVVTDASVRRRSAGGSGAPA